jgi:hypothetical protein
MPERLHGFCTDVGLIVWSGDAQLSTSYFMPYRTNIHRRRRASRWGKRDTANSDSTFKSAPRIMLLSETTGSWFKQCQLINIHYINCRPRPIAGLCTLLVDQRGPFIGLLSFVPAVVLSTLLRSEEKYSSHSQKYRHLDSCTSVTRYVRKFWALSDANWL